MIELAIGIMATFIVVVFILGIIGFSVEAVSEVMPPEKERKQIIKEFKEDFKKPTSRNQELAFVLVGVVIASLISLFFF